MALEGGLGTLEGGLVDRFTAPFLRTCLMVSPLNSSCVESCPLVLMLIFVNSIQGVSMSSGPGSMNKYRSRPGGGGGKHGTARQLVGVN